MVVVGQVFSFHLLAYYCSFYHSIIILCQKRLRIRYFVTNKTLRQVANQVNRQEISSIDQAIKLLDVCYS